MFFLYDLAVQFSAFILRILAFFSPKINLFVRGRQQTAGILKNFREPGKKLIWMHTASLGEFEQGLPVLEQLQQEYPHYQFLVSFFSPSGYEVKKGKVKGAHTCYLPLDQRNKVKQFLDTLNPEIAIFVKYEIWPNYFRELKHRQIPLIMVSAIFREKQIYFKWYGSFMRKVLDSVSHFYLQDKRSEELLLGIGIQNLSVSGDTRFDRVYKIRNQQSSLDFMEHFKGNRFCLVMGSSWPEDEALLPPLLEDSEKEKLCLVIAPHKTDSKTIEKLHRILGEQAVRYSQREEMDLDTARILIVDTIGLLTKIYGYADLAYVGGGFATGLHNTLEPAVYGIPVLCGPQYEGFKEAEDLVRLGGVRVTGHASEFKETVLEFLNSPAKKVEIGSINLKYITENKGASIQILDGIRTLLK
ncbi:3-deoxy-D-manno-octulosonic acid transferase [Robiginitalea sp. IMCC43444]|uniref:3-deoxy-D-manno-octulosonic acid transferase n=1 Tax=Robiginitalea sp. IMCC43444 TaxID=3459121 RepID=UPI0040436461